jgi:hypothetical protein
MIKENNLEFCFKGSRTYVHGTDIFNTLTNLLKDEMKNEKIDLTFHGIAKTNIILTTEKPKDEKLLKFVFKYIDKNENRKILYAIENNLTIKCQYEYFEEAICKLSHLDINNQQVVLTKNSSYTFVENTVALNKYLLENIFPEANGKWYFTRFQLNAIPQKIYPLKLELKTNFNFKLTKTEIFIADEPIGFIYFSLV